MRCLRNKIHANLFLTFILTNSCWITTSVMTSLQHSSSSLEVHTTDQQTLLLQVFFWHLETPTFSWIIKHDRVCHKLMDALTISTSKYFTMLFLQVSWCVSLVFSRYFHLATFFWMFVEGEGIHFISNFD